VEAAEDKDDGGQVCTTVVDESAHTVDATPNDRPDEDARQLTQQQQQQPPQQAEHKEEQESHEGQQMSECCEQKQHQAAATEKEIAVKADRQDEPLQQQQQQQCDAPQLAAPNKPETQGLQPVDTNGHHHHHHHQQQQQQQPPSGAAHDAEEGPGWRGEADGPGSDVGQEMDVDEHQGVADVEEYEALMALDQLSRDVGGTAAAAGMTTQPGAARRVREGSSRHSSASNGNSTVIGSGVRGSSDASGRTGKVVNVPYGNRYITYSAPRGQPINFDVPNLAGDTGPGGTDGPAAAAAVGAQDLLKLLSAHGGVQHHQMAGYPGSSAAGPGGGDAAAAFGGFLAGLQPGALAAAAQAAAVLGLGTSPLTGPAALTASSVPAAPASMAGLGLLGMLGGAAGPSNMTAALSQVLAAAGLNPEAAAAAAAATAVFAHQTSANQVTLGSNSATAAATAAVAGGGGGGAGALPSLLLPENPVLSAALALEDQQQPGRLSTGTDLLKLLGSAMQQPPL
jgi:hypothetical protein